MNNKYNIFRNSIKSELIININYLNIIIINLNFGKVF